MRYQQAYTYPGTQLVDRDMSEGNRGWQFTLPGFRRDRYNVIGLLRFALIITGMIALIVGMAHFFTAYSAQGWEKASAVVTRSDVVRMNYDDGVPVFTAKVEYLYVNDGQFRSGSSISLHPIRSHSPGEVKRMISPYKVGRSVSVLIHPDRADRAYLTTDPASYLYNLIIPGASLLLLSFLIGQALHLRAASEQRKVWRFGEFKTPDFGASEAMAKLRVTA